VGKDQEQHLEMTRKFARRFNNFYGVEFFKEPQAYNFGEELIKIPGLDGSGKMGKSEGNCVYLCDEPKVIEKKVMKALTDGGPQRPTHPSPITSKTSSPSSRSSRPRIPTTTSMRSGTPALFATGI